MTHPLVAEYRNAIRWAAGLWGPRPNKQSTVEDIVQTAYTWALPRWSEYDQSKGSVGAWFYSFVFHAFYKQWRRFRPLKNGTPRPHLMADCRGPGGEEPEAESAPRQEQIFEAREVLRRNDNVQFLNVRDPCIYQEVVRLVALGWNFEEIGEKFGKARSQIRGMYRAQLALIKGEVNAKATVRDVYSRADWRRDLDRVESETDSDSKPGLRARQRQAERHYLRGERQDWAGARSPSFRLGNTVKSSYTGA